MKFFLLLLLFISPVFSNELPESPKPKEAPIVVVKRSEHPFYANRTTRIVLLAEVGAWAADATITCRNLANGGNEQLLPTQSCAGVIGYTAMFHAAGEGAAYLLHRTHHHKLEQVPRLFLAGGNIRGIAYSAAHGGMQ